MAQSLSNRSSIHIYDFNNTLYVTLGRGSRIWLERIAMPAASPADVAASSRWSDLPFDLLPAISRRLHVAADYVRFHAVCKPWRDTLPPPRVPAAAPRAGRRHRPPDGSLHLLPQVRPALHRCRRDTRTGQEMGDSADGAAAAFWLLAASRQSTSLVTPLTGSAVAALLPPLPGGIRPWVKHGAGVVSGDGTVLLYGAAPVWMQARIMAALLRPGSTVWKSVQTNHYLRPYDRDMDSCCVTYHDGKTSGTTMVVPVTLKALRVRCRCRCMRCKRRKAVSCCGSRGMGRA
jgi:hypothetical protein